VEIRGFHSGFCCSEDSGFSLLLLRFVRVPFWVILGFSSFKGDVFFNKQKRTAIMFAGALFYLGNNDLLNKNLFLGSGIYTQEIKSLRQ
jgi:hypothetical protein